ncbi:MAG TPA: NAD(P)H-binding protein [Solirubrobacteraceae bacterium]|nr:NAD(P)H-binding protein [Solirubrobacteraceae bacterium]
MADATTPRGRSTDHLAAVRVLLIGGGRRGRALAAGLTSEGHAVRAVTRTQAGRAAIEAIGAECWIGDPDRIGTLRYALDNVTVVVWALGTATGEPEQVRALHGSRLTMLLERTIDTTARGFIYEVAGSVDPRALERGAAEVRRMCELNEVPYALLRADPADERAWAAAARAEIDRLLAADRRTSR